MKTRRKVGIALLVFVWLPVVAYLYYSDAESKAIIAVINQNAQNARDCTTVFGKRRDFNTRKFVNKVQGIDTSACPKKFQLTWLDYVHCWERQGEQTPGMVLSEAYLGLIGVATRSSSLSKLTTKPIETADALENSWQNVETVALEYNVRIVRKT
jgi:hypothetical protein